MPQRMSGLAAPTNGATIKQNGTLGSYRSGAWLPVVDTFRTLVLWPPPATPRCYAWRTPPTIVKRISR